MHGLNLTRKGRKLNISVKRLKGAIKGENYGQDLKKATVK